MSSLLHTKLFCYISISWLLVVGKEQAMQTFFNSILPSLALAGVLQLAVHRAVPVLHLLVPLLTPAPGLVICHLTLRVGVRAGDILAGVTAFITENIFKYIDNI